MRNLHILQSGGGVYFSSVANPYSAAAKADQSAASTSSSSKDDGLIPKDLLKSLGDKGIPVDVDKFYGMLADFERKSEFGLGVNKRQLYALQAYANRIVKQSEYLENAEKRADQNGALDEFAVDSKGYLYVPTEEGGVQKVHASQFNASQQRALTVGELIEYRRFSPDLVDDTSIATTIGNNIGIEKINDYIQGILKAVGSTDDASEAYVNLGSIVGRAAARKPNEQQMAAMKELYELAQQIGPDAIFKVKDQYKTKNMEAAMSYIMSMLPNNIRTQLVARNVAAGGKYENSSKYAAAIIGMAAEAANDTKISHGIEYDAGINKALGNDEESKRLQQATPMEVFWDGDLNRTEDILISDPNSKNKYGLSAPGNTWGVLTDDKGNDVTHVPLSVGLNAGMAKYLDLSQAYIGDIKIDPSQLQDIAYESDKIAAVWLPIDSEGNIDWRGFKAYSQAEKEIKEQHLTDPKDKADKHRQKGSYITYNSRGEAIPLRKVEKFFMTYGYTSGNIIGDSTLSVELKGDREDAAEELIDAIYSKKIKQSTGIGGIRGKHWWNNIYKTPIFIKASKTASTDARIAAGHGPADHLHPLQDFMVKQEMMKEPEQEILPKSQFLFEQ